MNLSQKLKVTSLFWHFTVNAPDFSVDSKSLLQFKWCPYPAFIAISTSQMYSDQSKFAEHLHMFSTTYFKVSCNVVKYILNGPNLLSKITKWARHQTFKSRVKQSFKCVMKHYGNYRVVMFDGYQQTPTAKDYLHTERT